MQQQIEDLEAAILDGSIIDKEDIHHEFVTGMHGRKIDMDLIATGSQLYEEWVNVIVDYIEQNYEELPAVVVGVANGANRLAVSVARKLSSRPFGLMTEKASSKSSKLHPSVADVVSGYKPAFVLVLEDVGTSGTTSLTAVNELKQAGAQRVEVLNTWQRTASLDKLEQANVAYRSIIKHPLPTYQPEECLYCTQGIELINHA